MAMFKVAWALLALSERELLRCTDMEEMMSFLQKTLPLWADTHLDRVIAQARSAHVTPEQLAQYASGTKTGDVKSCRTR